MAIDLQSIIYSQLGVRLVSFAGRITPPSVGFKIADHVAKWIADQRHLDFVRAIRTNQWVIRGAGPDKEALDQAVGDNLKNIAHSIYSLYHYIDRPKAVQNMLVLSPEAHRLVGRPAFSGRGLMLVGLHLSNFDLILQSMAMQGLKVFVLTIPDPQGGRRIEYETRKRTGMHLVPASVSGMRRAVEHLKCGGVVLTGIDRPVSGLKTRPRFFGQASSLPVHHIYLARKANVPVRIVAARLGTDGRYLVSTSEPVEMEAVPDHEEGTLRNAEKVLKEAEQFILRAPEQWNMSLPVWPDLMDHVPV